MIYCVEDDNSIRDLIVYALKSAGYDASGYSDAESFLEALKNKLPSLILLDIMLPGKNGMEILKILKSKNHTKDIPVIMLTAKSSEYDKVLGLDNGADDYITKPFGVMELISRIKAVLRRYKKNDPNELSAGGVVLNPEKHFVLVNHREISLTLKEFELLKYLMENKSIVLNRHQLLENIWGYEYEGETRTVDVHIRTLRQKLGDSGSIIETIRGVGYRIGEGR